MVQEQNQIKKNPYLFAVGRRKSAIARLRFYPGETHSFVINAKPLDTYFPRPVERLVVMSPLETVQKKEAGRFEVKVVGGGVTAQAESIRHALSRVLVNFDKVLRPTLKKAGFLRRDPRVKERKKPGLKKARRAPQWQKR